MFWLECIVKVLKNNLEILKRVSPHSSVDEWGIYLWQDNFEFYTLSMTQ